MEDLERFAAELISRAEGSCEFCDGKNDLEAHPVPGRTIAAETCVLLCGTCLGQVTKAVAMDAKHWFCLNTSVWSEVPAVQVLSWRMLGLMQSEGWAQDLLAQMYLQPDVEEWAKSGADEDDAVVTLDSNGKVLENGDSVTIIKDLDVKGTGFVAKRGTLVKNIRLIDDPDNIEGRVNKTTLVLKTKFLKKA